ncbi:MAG: transposase [Ferroplasma sp.]
MKAIRTEQVYLGENAVISKMCHFSKNLYNQVNYILRQQFIKHEKQANYFNLVKKFQVPSDNNEYNNYQKLPAQTGEWTIKKAKESWNSFFKAYKTYKKQPALFTGKPAIPKYKSKNGEFMLIFTNQQCRIENNILKFPKSIGLEVKTRLKEIDLREVRIVPIGTGYNIEIVYRIEISNIVAGNNNIMGIDIGVENIAAIADNISKQGIIIKGGFLKSMNQYFNKEYAHLKSISDRQIGKKLTEREKKLFLKRNRKIKNAMHTVSRRIIDYAISKNIDTIVIGHIGGWKQSVNIGHRNNQNFVQIPFNMLIDQIKYKAEEHGIDVMIIDEAYTSKCSFLDNESIEHHDIYAGKRIRRGLFKTSKGILINADLNAAYNMIKKAFPESFEDGIEGVGLHPGSLSIGQMITSKGGC